MEKSLHSKCLTKTYVKKSNITWTLKIKVWVNCICNLYNKFKVHVLWPVFS